MGGDSGFTLIEMMIVVAIIGVLASAAIPAFMRYMARARNIEGIHNSSKIADGARAYFDAHGVLPASSCSPTFCSGYAGAPMIPSQFEICRSYGGVYPEAAKVQFKQPPYKEMFDQLLFYPEGNIRFFHMFTSSSFKPPSAGTYGYTWVSRYETCPSSGKRRWIRFRHYLRYVNGILDKQGPHRHIRIM